MMSARPEQAAVAESIRYQDGFGWTNGVTLKMLDLVCPKEKPCDSVPTARPAANDDNGKATDVPGAACRSAAGCGRGEKSRAVNLRRGGGPAARLYQFAVPESAGRWLPAS